MVTLPRGLLALVFSVIFLEGPAQPGLEELRRQYARERGTARIETGLLVGDSLVEQPEALLKFSLSLLEEARKKVPGTLLLARVYRQVSDGYYYNDSLRLAGEYLAEAARLAETLLPVDSLFTGSAYNDLGIIYMDLGHRRESREVLEKAMAFLGGTGNPESLADAYSNMGSLDYMEGRYEEAILYYQQAYQIDLETHNVPRQSSSLNNLGRIYIDWGKHETGLDYYFRSVALLDTVADRPTLSVRYNNIGMAYQLMGRHREAIAWIEKARAIDEAEGLVLRLGTRWFNLANAWKALGNPLKAGECLLLAEQYSRQTGQLPMLTKVHAGLGQHYLDQGDPVKALHHFQQSQQFAEAGGSLTEKANSYEHLYRFYKLMGMSGEALHYHELLTAARDSVFSLEVSGKVEELEMEYQTSQKEAEISRLEAENALQVREVSFRKRERNWAMAGLGLMVAFMAGLYGLYTTVRRQKATLTRQNEELDQLNKTQSRLFGIISHDLRNATAAYQSSARVMTHYLNRGEPEKLLPLASEISKNAKVLSGMLDNLLQWSLLRMKGVEPELGLVPVKEEILQVVELMKDYASGKSNTMVVEVAEEKVWCDPGSFQIIMRNLLSNALKFTAGGSVTIRAHQSDGTTTLEVSDTGCGMEADRVEELFRPGWKEVRRGTGGERGTGLGLSLVAEHVARNQGSVSAESQPGKGMTVRVILPSHKI